MSIVKVEGSIYLGSSADDSVGIGYMIRGKSYTRTNEGFELECFDGEIIKVYDVIEIKTNMCELDDESIDSPGTTIIRWVEA